MLHLHSLKDIAGPNNWDFSQGIISHDRPVISPVGMTSGLPTTGEGKYQQVYYVGCMYIFLDNRACYAIAHCFNFPVFSLFLQFM